MNAHAMSVCRRLPSANQSTDLILVQHDVLGCEYEIAGAAPYPPRQTATGRTPHAREVVRRASGP